MGKISAKLRKYAASLCASNQEEFENIFMLLKEDMIIGARLCMEMQKLWLKYLIMN